VPSRHIPLNENTPCQIHGFSRGFHAPLKPKANNVKLNEPVEEHCRVPLTGTRQKGNHFITGIKHIVATSPFTMNNNALVIRDKFITGLNDVYRAAFGSILEEREFLVGHSWWYCVDSILYISWNIFLQINNYMRREGSDNPRYYYA